MGHPDDFSPIVEQGELEASAGMLARLRGRRELPPVGVGVELVLVDKDGTLAGGREITGGERYWTRASSWIKVDVAEHTLDFKVPFSDPTGRAGFVAVVTVSVRIANSVDVAASAPSGVKGFIEPALGEAVATCASSVEPSSGEDPVAALNDSRRAAEAALRTSIRKENVDLPSWLSASVKSVNVSFDESTKRHYDDLVRRARDGELFGAAADNKTRETEHAIAIRSQWREALVPHLSDPATRSFEVVLADPSPQNIAKVVDQVNATDAIARERVYHVLSSLIDNDHLHKTSELPEMMKEILAGLRIGDAPTEPPSLGAGAQQPVIDAEAHTVQEEVDQGDAGKGRE